MAPRVGLGDFEIGRFVGRRRPESIGEGDVVSATTSLHPGKTFALKRIEVAAKREEAEALFNDLTRSTKLQKHAAWLGIYNDISFIHEYQDRYGHSRARCCVVEELADRNLENEIVERAVSDNSFEERELFRLWATLLHGLQALHRQGALHRNVTATNVFFVNEEIKLGTPGPSSAQPAQCYPGSVCKAYSADIFALGLVFLEMALLHPISDLVVMGYQALHNEILALDTVGLCSWIDDQAVLLGQPQLDHNVVKVLVAMLTSDQCARPTADDLLDWPVFAPYVDPAQVLPMEQRPCVIMAHRGLAPKDVPRRSVFMLPDVNQIFSHEGAEIAEREGRYRWCGGTYDLWWFETSDFKLSDHTDVAALEAKDACTLDTLTFPLPQLSAYLARAAASSSEELYGAVVEAAHIHRAEKRLVAAEVFYRAALSVDQNDAVTWLGLASVQLERGHLMNGRLLFEHARKMIRANSQPAEAAVTLFGLCEFFVAVEALKNLVQQAKSQAIEDRNADPKAVLRASHVALYYRSTLAMEAGDAEAFAALGEFYRVIGCPEVPLMRPAPDLATAASYFEQAQVIKPTHNFVLDRLRRMQGGGIDEEDPVGDLQAAYDGV